MAGAFPPTQKWALLVGIDFYMTGKARMDSSGRVVHYPNLAGCVNDVALVECFLTDDLELSSDQILKLTSSVPDEAGQNVPKEDPSSWPTYRNISQAFRYILDKGQCGDSVYIHYSGHGARVKTAVTSLKGPDGIDEALVPVDIEVFSEKDQGRYIRDFKIASWLQRLVDKGLRITLVLDSCHAGSSNRTKRDTATRGTGVLDHSFLPSDVCEEALKRLPLPLLPDGSRQGRVQKNWLLEASGYTLVAACTAFQKAHEYRFAERTHGALTYYLIEAIRSSPASMPLSMLLGRVSVKVQSHFSEQTPTLDGEDESAFFGIYRPPHASIHEIRVLKVDLAKNCVELDNGDLHGVHEGAEYAIFSDEMSSNSAIIARVRVDQCLGLKSVATFMDASESDRQAVRPGYPASLVKQAQEKLATVRLTRPGTAPNSEEQLSWLEDIRRRVDQPTRAYPVWRLLPDDDDEAADPATLSVTVTDKGFYELSDASQVPIQNLPQLRVGETSSRDKLLGYISHVTQFQLVQRLGADRVSALRTPCTLELEGKSTKPPLQLSLPDLSGELVFPAGLEPVTPNNGIYTVKAGEVICIAFRNKGKSAVYVTLFDLMPLWGVKKIYPVDGGWSECVGPGEKRTLPIQMDIPQSILKDGGLEITDTLKAIITISPTSLEVLELPEIGEGYSRTSFVSHFTSQLDQVLQNLSTKIRDAKLKRQMVGSWQVFDIKIRTITGEMSGNPEISKVSA